MVYGRCKILKDWNNWDSEIHTDESQIARQGRAMTYDFGYEVNEKTETAIFSSTSDLPYYTTSLSKCNCYDFQKRGLPCKHIYRLAVELGYIEIIKRPAFDKDKLSEIKESSDIDNHPDQIKRQASAMDKKCTPISIDHENGVGIFSGSGKTPYTTTVDTCTCRDFFVRKLPCKHIYRLRYEIDGFVKMDNSK